MTLNYVGQEDFAAGILQGVARDIQPGVGVAMAVNGLFNDDGDVYRRGGTKRFSPVVSPYPVPNAIEPQPITFLWQGFLNDKAESIIGIGPYNVVGPGLDFPTGRLYETDPVTFGSRDDVWGGNPSGTVFPVRPAIVADTLFLPTGQAWSGSFKGPSVVTVTVTQYVPPAAGNPDNEAAAKRVTVPVGGFDFNILQAGMFMTVSGVNYRIAKIVSATELTLDSVYTGAGGSVSATFNGMLHNATGVPIQPNPGMGTVQVMRHVAACANRLVIAEGNKIRFSEAEKPFSFIPDDYHELADGVIVTGLAAIRDTLLVFTTFGLWGIQNMALDLTDDFGNLQHIVSLITPELTLWGEAGIAEWAGRIIAPCVDRVYLIDGLSQPVPISDSITPLYLEHVKAGHFPGNAAAWRGHYLLPIIASDRSVKDALVCRAERPVKGRQVYYPWSRLTDYGGNVLGYFASTAVTPPKLLGMGHDGWVLDASDIFSPKEENAADGDGSAFEWGVETRDFPSGNGQPNHVRRLRIYYSLSSGQIEGSFSTSGDPLTTDSRWGTMVWGQDAWQTSDLDQWAVLPYSAPANAGRDPHTWQFPRTVRTRYIRARLRCTDPVGRLRLHKLEFGVRPATHRR